MRSALCLGVSFDRLTAVHCPAGPPPPILSTMSDRLEDLKTALAGRYEIERELGHGGMATVYLAADLRHHRQVAVKVLRPDLAAAMGPERFLREIEIAANLTHPHILPLHDSGEAEGFLYYVMPYVEGESLRDRLNREKQLGVDEALEITEEVADALSYAHSHDVVHRDIKPENILLSGSHAVVADFGIARAVSEAGGEKLTQTGLAVGTPAYMSPEQASADAELDGRSDVYSLGCVLYEMLSGKPPYTGPTAQAIMAKRLADPVPSVRRVRETIPPEVDQALTKAMAKVPADRFASGTHFVEALNAKNSPLTLSNRVSRSAKVAVTTLVIALVVTVSVFVASGGSDLIREQVVVATFDNRTGDPSLDPIGRAATDWIVQGLTRTNITDAVFTMDALGVRVRSGEVEEAGNRGQAIRVARAAGVGTVVTGTYYLRGDTLELQA